MNGKPAFMVDHMLIGLGKYLRILGYDAAWDPALRTHDLIVRANAQGRVFLTRNRRLSHAYPQPARALVLDTTDPVAQFRAVAAAFGLDTGRWLFSRCIRCNRELVPMERADAAGRVHPNVGRQYACFTTCPCCGTVFWKGGHVRNTCRKLGLPDASEPRRE